MTNGFRLSPQQARLWTLQQQSSAYRVQIAILIEGSLNKNGLRAAVARLIDRHSILRATFRHLPGMNAPLQVIGARSEMTWSECELSHLPGDSQIERIARLFRRDQVPDFDFERGPLVHTVLAALSNQKHVLVLSLPAICADSRTGKNIFQEIGRLYSGQDGGSEEETAQYIQFAEWENELIEDDTEEDGKRFWRAFDLRAASDFRLPFENASAVEEYHFNPESTSRIFGAELRGALESLALKFGTSIEELLLAAWQALLARLTNRSEFVIGAGVDGRKYDELVAALGAFARFVPLECRTGTEAGFNQLLEDAATSLREARARLEYFAWDPDPGQRTPFLPIQYEFDEAAPGYEANGLHFSLIRESSCIDRFRLKLRCVAGDSWLSSEIHYDPRYVPAPAVELMADYFGEMLRAILESPAADVADFGLCGDATRTGLETFWRGEAVEYPRHLSVARLFEDQVQRLPDRIAAVFEDQQVSYGELNGKANQLAHRLIKGGAQVGAVVALCVERSLEMIVGLLGTMKAGGTYLPLDPDLPAARIEYQLSESGAAVLITTSSLLDRLPAFFGETILLSEDWKPFDGARSDDPRIEIAPQSPAYVIYTSGSTGAPKGVAVSHRNLVNYVYAVSNRLRLFEADSGLSFATVSTIAADLGNTVIFPSLLGGGCLHVVAGEVATDGNQLARYFSERDIDVLKIVPSHLKGLLSEVEGARPRWKLILGGEALSVEFAARMASKLQVVNHYGPTETTIGSLTCNFNEDEQHSSTGPNVPIGRPIGNTQVYIMDRRMNPVPPGVAGEIYIGGDGVAQCYVNKPEQTAERFVPNPYAAGERLYKTGDRGRFLLDRRVEFMGRVDNQVKIHGYRIELGEIESALTGHPAVREAVVVQREDEKDRKRLVAYYVPDRASHARHELARFLKEKLPVYMIPSAFIPLKALPLTANGKIDRQRLPIPDERPAAANEEPGVDTVAPRTRTETALCEIWKSVLRVERVGIYDNFFELGGDSILSLQIVARAGRAGIHLTHKQLFERPTIASLAEVAAHRETSQAEQGLVIGSAPLTPIQRWFFEHNVTDPHHWNLGTLLEVWPRCDAAVMGQSVQRLALHHDALRLRFVREGETWLQTNAAPDDRENFTTIDLSIVAAELQKEAIEGKAAELQGSLDLSEGPLFRVVLFDLGEDKPQRLLIVVHHLLVDGISWRVLMEDLQSLYEQISRGDPVTLPRKTTSFRQWAEGLGRHMSSGTVQDELEWWLARTPSAAGGVKPDYPGGVARNLEASARSVVTTLDAEETRALLQTVPPVYNTQINDALLTALLQAFAAVSGERSIWIDLEGHGREPIADEIDLSRTVGWFTTHFPVMLELSRSSDAGDALKAVKEQLRAIPAHGIGWGLLRYMSDQPEIRQKCSELPAPEVSFNYLGQFETSTSESRFRPARESYGLNKSPRGTRSHLLRINASVIDGELQLNWSYSENVHERSTIEALAASFMDSLRSLIAHCASPDAGGRTPSDFSETGLSQNDIDIVLSAVSKGRDKTARPGENVEDIYSLSPLQEGMLFHSLAAQGIDSYVRQLSFEIKGALDVEAFEYAWRQVAERHSALRTSFFWQGIHNPLQLVHRRAVPVLALHDWRGSSRSVQDELFDEFLRADRQLGFDLAVPPLMRIALIRTAGDSHRFVWSYHHLIMDAWSRALIYKEVLRLYEAGKAGVDAGLKPAARYGEYISWLRRQNHSEAGKFWRRQLEGFSSRTMIAASQSTARDASGNSMEAEEVVLSTADTSSLRSLAQQHALTLNTLIQGAWGLILSRYSGEQDIAFGTVVSGRPAGLIGVESIVGALINTLVMRLQVPLSASLLSWLAGIQSLQATMSEFEFSPLVEVQRCGGVPRGAPMFDTVLNFANHPLFDAERTSNEHLKAGDLRFREENPYPLVVHVSAGRELSLRATYNTRQFDRELVLDVLSNLRRLLRLFVEDPGCRLRDLFSDAHTDFPSSDAAEINALSDEEAEFVF